MVQELDHWGVHVVRADVADFPERVHLDARLSAGRWSGRLGTAQHELALEELRSVWYRNLLRSGSPV
ncbi:MvdC/MvdD family ATP grasp protein [Gandjariella thermophila]|uniref:MvdC/MvdD family ATP grasp protein n=1 Tax=Gandjariella thermophila TaxID=1931992 RepID=UPI00353095A3